MSLLMLLPVLVIVVALAGVILFTWVVRRGPSGGRSQQPPFPPQQGYGPPQQAYGQPQGYGPPPQAYGPPPGQPPGAGQ
jgi:hypothetical protein